jgi:hypothetical protein
VSKAVEVRSEPFIDNDFVHPLSQQKVDMVDVDF